MKDFIDGCAVLVPPEDTRAFLRMCDEYGLLWESGLTPLQYIPAAQSHFGTWIARNARGCLVYSRIPFEGRKAQHYESVRPLRYNFAQFMRGEFALHVQPREMADFLDLCTRNHVLWTTGEPPRAGMKGIRIPKEGIYFFYKRLNFMREPRLTYAASARWEKSVEFRYIARNYEVPRTTTLDAVKATEAAQRKASRAAQVAVRFIKPSIGSLRRNPIATESKTILITSNAGSNLTRLRYGSRLLQGGDTGTITVEARCSDGDEYSFEVGAMVALARLLGREAWFKAAKEVIHMFDRTAAREQSEEQKSS